MSSAAGALEAIDRILNRGGDADDVLRAVLRALHERGVSYAAIRFVERGELGAGPSVGDPTDDTLTVPVEYRGEQVGELEASTGDRPLLQRIATLISAHVLVAWDTGGERWAP